MDSRTAGAPSRSRMSAAGTPSPQEADGVDDDAALASLDLRARAKAAKPSAFGGFHALAVDHARARTGLAPFRLPCLHPRVSMASAKRIDCNRPLSRQP